MAEHRDALGFEFAVAAQPADRLQRLNEVKPDIVHFAGSAARVAGRVPFHRPKSAFFVQEWDRRRCEATDRIGVTAMASRVSAIRWVTSLIGVALLAAIVLPSPAQAAGPVRSDPVAGSAADAGPPELRAAKPGMDRLNRQVSGPYDGTHVIVFEACGIVSQSYDLRYTAESGGSGSLVLEGCVADAGENFAYHGDFTLTTPSGAVLRGTVEGTALPVDLTLNVTSSQGRQFRCVAGSIAMVGEWSGNPTGPASGTLVGALVRARR